MVALGGISILVFIVSLIIMIAFLVLKNIRKQKKIALPGRIFGVICLASVLTFILAFVFDEIIKNDNSININGSVNMEESSSKSLLNAVKLADIASDNVNISLNDGEAEIEITKNPLTAYEVNKFTSYIMRETKEMDDLESLNIVWFTTLVDSYGNESNDEVANILVSYDTIQKVNYKNFIPSQLENIAESYKISNVIK